MNSFFFSLAMFCTARPTAETGTSTIRSTCSTSYQRRAMAPPISGLSWWSPTITLIGLPRTLPPKSSTAICAAVTEPWPVGVDAGPFMSVRTPILTTSSEICARAGDASAAAASSPSANPRLAEIKAVLPQFFGPAPLFRRRRPRLDRARSRSRWASPCFVQSIHGPRQRRPLTMALGGSLGGSLGVSLGAARSGREADLSGGGGIVARQLRGALLQPRVAQEADQRLDRGPEIAALPHQEIETLPD